MPPLPFLFFPASEEASRTRLKPGFRHFNKPTVLQQVQRTTPMFRRLQDAFDQESIRLQSSSVGVHPELALVIQTVGSVDNFIHAVRKIPGLEWLGESIRTDIPPDDNFYDSKDHGKTLTGHLYLVMSNQVALQQLLSLWERYSADPAAINFRTPEYKGLAKFKDLFLALKDIRVWGVHDRLEEQGLLEDWQRRVADAEDLIRFEVEFWYRKDESMRQKGEAVVADLIGQLEGRVVSRAHIESISYHAVLGELPIRRVREILNTPDVNLFRCEDIMFFRPVGQITAGEMPDENEEPFIGTLSPGPTGDPVIALLDGFPLENHRLLAGRLIVDDPDNWGVDCPVARRIHGTAMASLIVHGDLVSAEGPIRRPIYVRPIIKPRPNCMVELAPEDILFVDYVHCAVKRMLEGDARNTAVAPTVKIINFSIGDTGRHFLRDMSPLARLLDWLSAKHNVLFIISSGNHANDIEVGVTGREFEALSMPDREKLVVGEICRDIRNRKILSPGESINGLTVGALHQNNSSAQPFGVQNDVFRRNFPSPVSAFGFGYRNAIKPDFLFQAGCVLYHYLPQSKLQQTSSTPLGHKVAAPSSIVTTSDPTKFCCGSSNAAALTSRLAGFCYDRLANLFSETGRTADFGDFGVPLLKAVLVHGCSWGETGNQLQNSLDDNELDKSWVSRWIGYGGLSRDKTLGCHQQRATLLGFGRLTDEGAHVYVLPLPTSLSGRREWRKLTVTLAWISPIVPTTQAYRGVRLWFDFEDGTDSRVRLKEKTGVSGVDCSAFDTKKGTVQHEVFEGERAVALAGGDGLKIKVNCRSDAKEFATPIAYGLVVSIEVAEGVPLPIYDEIRNRVITPVGVRT